MITKALVQINEEMTKACEDSTKFAAGNNSAGTRLRIAMQNIKKLAQDVRNEVSETKNAA